MHIGITYNLPVDYVWLRMTTIQTLLPPTF